MANFAGIFEIGIYINGLLIRLEAVGYRVQRWAIRGVIMIYRGN